MRAVRELVEQDGVKILVGPHIERKDGRGEACADGVVRPNGLIKFGITHHVENRRKGFAQYRTSLPRHLAESGTRVIGVIAADCGNALPAMQDGASFARLF